MPLLFSICAGAQRAAAAGALAAAGVPGVSCSVAGNELGVILETVQEYFWRLLIDWPEAMGREALAQPVAAVRRQIAAMPAGRRRRARGQNATATGELGAALRALATQTHLRHVACGMALAGRGDGAASMGGARRDAAREAARRTPAGDAGGRAQRRGPDAADRAGDPRCRHRAGDGRTPVRADADVEWRPGGDRRVWRGCARNRWSRHKSHAMAMPSRRGWSRGWWNSP